MSGASEDRDMLAAEYVLGTLDAAERHAVGEQARHDQVLAAAIADWEARLTPLGRLPEPVTPPPELWQQIAAHTAPRAPDTHRAPGAWQRGWRSATLWRRWAIGSTAVAASLAALLLFRSPSEPTPIVLLLAANPTALFVAQIASDRSVTLRPAGNVVVPQERDFELWSLAPGSSAPRSLGVLPVTGRRLSLHSALPPSTRLLVSLEPKGGSPTGLPTGPVLFAGMLPSAPELAR